MTWICIFVTIPESYWRWQMPDRNLSDRLFLWFKKISGNELFALPLSGGLVV